MCEQCSAACVNYGEVIPHWWLVRATQDGLEMKAGEWGLVYINDPSFIWPSELIAIKDPTFEFTDEELEKLGNNYDSDEKDFWEICGKIEEFLYCDPMEGYKLIEAAKVAGYDPEKHGYRFGSWLVHQIALVIESNPEANDDIASKLDKEREQNWGVNYERETQ